MKHLFYTYNKYRDANIEQIHIYIIWQTQV